MKAHNLFLQTAHTAPPDLLGLISVLLQNSGLVDIRRGLINMRIASVRFEHIQFPSSATKGPRG